jgi:hypothetical protein
MQTCKPLHLQSSHLLVYMFVFLYFILKFDHLHLRRGRPIFCPPNLITSINHEKIKPSELKKKKEIIVSGNWIGSIKINWLQDSINLSLWRGREDVHGVRFFQRLKGGETIAIENWLCDPTLKNDKLHCYKK